MPITEALKCETLQLRLFDISDKQLSCDEISEEINKICNGGCKGCGKKQKLCTVLQ